MFGLKSTQEQLADFRAESDSGVALVHVATCLSSYLQDHHNRDGECLFGVYVDGNASVGDVLAWLGDEIVQTGERIPSYVTDEQIKAAITAWGEGIDKDRPFDASLDVPAVDDDGERIDDDAAEGPQAWFVLTWETPPVKLYYANHPETGLSVVIGNAGQVAHTAEANAYRATEEELASELAAIEAEYGTTETIRFDTAAELEAAYKEGGDAEK